jgi:hypothetical protein
MIEHFALDLCAAVGNLMQHLEMLRSRMTSFGALERPYLGMAEDLTKEEKDHVAEVVADPLAREGERIGLELTAKRARRLSGELKEGRRYSAELLALELNGLRENIVEELAKRKFAYIPPERVAYFEQEHLFGEAVSKSFPEASKEIGDAGNCLAAWLDTAAVFHLMRAAEIGMRALAGERHVKIKNTSLDWAEWGTLVSALQKKADAIESWKGRSQSKSLALEFYRGAIRELEAFKVEYRNHVMHTRMRLEPKNPHRAVSVFSEVRGFMQRLTDNGISESQKKSIVWRKRPKQVV